MDKTSNERSPQRNLWNKEGGSFFRNLLVNMLFKFPMYAVKDLNANKLVDSLLPYFYDK